MLIFLTLIPRTSLLNLLKYQTNVDYTELEKPLRCHENMESPMAYANFKIASEKYHTALHDYKIKI
jgi:hypothetical protein